MRILITGAGGLLGGRLCVLLSQLHETVGLVREQEAPETIESLRVDLVDESEVLSALHRARPTAVIHCAALADPEVCEREPERARRNNVSATRALARVCRLQNARLISISTDLVFGGESAFATETSLPNPLSQYGRTKWLAEAAAFEECPDALIFRVALIVGRGHAARLSASESLAQRFARGEAPTLYLDEWRTPIDPESVALAIDAALLRPSVQGLVHLGGAERLTRVELGERMRAILGRTDATIHRAPQSSHRGAPRPRDVSLDIRRARDELGWTPRPLDLALGEGRRG